MHVAGRAPNCSVFFGGSAAEATAPHAHGYLVLDRRPEACGARYLFLEDGDVLHAPGESWLEQTNDELVTLLAKSLADARMGGSGWLATTDGSVETPEAREIREARELKEQVPDRRSAARPIRDRSAAPSFVSRAERRPGAGLGVDAWLWYKQRREPPGGRT